MADSQLIIYELATVIFRIFIKKYLWLISCESSTNIFQISIKFIKFILSIYVGDLLRISHENFKKM
jgi:hypothetical protein